MKTERFRMTNDHWTSYNFERQQAAGFKERTKLARINIKLNAAKEKQQIERKGNKAWRKMLTKQKAQTT